MDVIIFATKNKGKIHEANEILHDFSYEVVSMEEVGIHTDVIEDGDTFEENALKKAREIAKISGKIAMADDSGLCVDALDGGPGIFSARFAGEEATDLDKNNKLMELLIDVPDGERGAHFVCVMAVAFPDGREFTVRGECHGSIARVPSGENGFGYDPIFFMEEFGCTTAQMTPPQKHSISHRGQAMRKMKEELEKLL